MGTGEHQMKPDDIHYIGDGVYVRFTGYRLEVMTGHHLTPDMLIVLEPVQMITMYNILKEILLSPDQEARK
jgi:hypothetical protein